MVEILKQIENSEDLSSQSAEFQRLSKNKKLELLDELKKIRHDNAGKLLNLIYIDEKDKDIRKHIRSLLHKLKTTGIKIEEPKISGEPVLRKIEEIKEHKGFMSNFDDFNTRVGVTAFQVKKNSYIVLSGVIRFEDGLEDLLTIPVDRKGLNDIINKYSHRNSEGLAFVEVSPAYSIYILEEASNKAGKFIEEMAQARKVLSHEQDFIREPKDIYDLEIPETTRALSVEKVLEHAIFEPFKLTWSSIEEDKKEYNSFADSSIVLPPYMIEEKKQAFLKTLIEKDDIKLTVQFIKRMLEDYAYIFHSIKELPYYKGLIEYLHSNDRPLDPIIYFIKKSLAVEEKKTDGLIVNPYG